MEYFRQLWEYLSKPYHFDVLLTTITVFTVVAGGLFALIKWSSSVSAKRIDMLEKIVRQLRFDRNICNTMYTIDYDKFSYGNNFHNGQEQEFEIDKLLSYLNFICYLKRVRSISKKEFSVIDYEINRVCRSHAIRHYLWNIYHFSESQESECSFNYLIEYMLQNSRINVKEFKDKNSEYYIKTLNF